MLWSLLDLLLQIECALSRLGAVFLRPAIAVWGNLWIEWLALQTLIGYSVYRIYITINPLRQIMAIMWFVVLLCLYLGLWQFELFACFLFLGEFTIMIFFYCLFLHLKTAITSSTGANKIPTTALLVLVFALLLFAVFSGRTLHSTIGADISQSVLNLYPMALDFSLGDLTFLFYFFVSANLSVHALIGLTLFILTLFLFIVVLLYTSINLNRRAAFRITSNKLFTTKGYYEQSAFSSQKFFSHK